MNQSLFYLNLPRLTYSTERVTDESMENLMNAQYRQGFIAALLLLYFALASVVRKVGAPCRIFITTNPTCNQPMTIYVFYQYTCVWVHVYTYM